MMGGFASRRNAVEFDALLSGRAVDTAEYDELVRLVGSIRALPEVTARPAFVADLRTQLVAAAVTELAPAAIDPLTTVKLTPRQRQGARERRIATALGGFAVVAASGSMAVAAQGALPGDVLYPMKRAIENAQTNLQADDTERAETLLAHAEQRLAEAEELSARGDDADQIAATLQDFTEQTNQATELVLDTYAETGDNELLTDLRDFAADSMSDLTALGDTVPAGARPALIAAAQTVLQVDTQALRVCPACGDAPLTELPGFAVIDPISMMLDTTAPNPETTLVEPTLLVGGPDDDSDGKGDPKGDDRSDDDNETVEAPTDDLSTDVPDAEDDGPIGDLTDDVFDGDGDGDGDGGDGDGDTNVTYDTEDLPDDLSGVVDDLL